MKWDNNILKNVKINTIGQSTKDVQELENDNWEKEKDINQSKKLYSITKNILRTPVDTIFNLPSDFNFADYENTVIGLEDTENEKIVITSVCKLDSEDLVLNPPYNYFSIENNKIYSISVIG
jgi:hypothetical protein